VFVCVCVCVCVSVTAVGPRTLRRGVPNVFLMCS
jgi:hypothetical protein